MRIFIEFRCEKDLPSEGTLPEEGVLLAVLLLPGDNLQVVFCDISEVYSVTPT